MALWVFASAVTSSLPPTILPQHTFSPRPLPRMLSARRPALTADVHVSMLGTAPLTEPLVTLFKVEGVQCGEAHVRREIVPFAQQFAGLQMGDCASIGYVKPTSARTISVPVVGTIRIALYSTS
ncbi:hypothetical protein KFE25_013934 [Diacronema lutheri]|uniref:Uncharacterized protein n=2 Tax=Diacronema lutheri TaxID=2081491 RepID=A0A8J6C9T0_DIALT|nr:hypothetical protein KFE25_013934 [Diacronema lutheri]